MQTIRRLPTPGAVRARKYREHFDIFLSVSRRPCRLVDVVDAGLTGLWGTGVCDPADISMSLLLDT